MNNLTQDIYKTFQPETLVELHKSENNLVHSLCNVMKPEIYNGYPLRQISKDKYQFGIKTGTKEEIKRFIDSFKK